MKIIKLNESKESIELTDEQWEIVEEIIQNYISSRPVSGDWDNEPKYEALEIADALDISFDEAKTIMINYLGFTEEQFNASDDNEAWYD